MITYHTNKTHKRISWNSKKWSSYEKTYSEKILFQKSTRMIHQSEKQLRVWI